jgi:hypothetical protein
MLILKKKIIFTSIKKLNSNIIRQKKVIYFFIKKKLILLLSLSNCVLKKYIIVTKNLTYMYSLKYSCNSPFILNSKLNFLIEFFYRLKNGSIKNLNYLSHYKYFISIIRSPFIYKKSMEQFFFKRYTMYYETNISIYNFFFNNYQYKYIKKILQKKKNSKLFCKVIFNFD